jgi:RDD family
VPAGLRTRRALGYVVDAGPIWLAQCLGVGRVLVTMFPLYVAGVGILDPKTGKSLLEDELWDAVDLALQWIPGLCVWALVQALAVDLLGASMGGLAGRLDVMVEGGTPASRSRRLARELVRIAPAAGVMGAAGVISALGAHATSYWVLAGGVALAVLSGAASGVLVASGRRSVLDALTGTRVGYRAEPTSATT